MADRTGKQPAEHEEHRVGVYETPKSGNKRWLTLLLLLIVVALAAYMLITFVL